MPKSIKVAATKSNKEDQWPLFFTPELMKNKKILQDIGINSYILSSMANYPHTTNTYFLLNDLLLISNQYYFSTDEMFSRYKDIVYNHIPLYKTAFSDNELLEYYALNHINVTIEEIDNPDLSGYVLEW